MSRVHDYITQAYALQDRQAILSRLADIDLRYEALSRPFQQAGINPVTGARACAELEALPQFEREPLLAMLRRIEAAMQAA